MPDQDRNPYRMKGFYRAVKRNDKWAMRIWERRKNKISYALALVYRNINWKPLIDGYKPFFEILKEGDGCEGKYFPIKWAKEKK